MRTEAEIRDKLVELETVQTDFEASIGTIGEVKRAAAAIQALVHQRAALLWVLEERELNT